MPYNCWYKARFCLLAKTVLKAGREFFKRLKSTRLENCWFRNQQTREKELVKDLLHHCHTLHLSNEFIRFKIKFSDFSWHCWLCWICQFAKSGNYFLSSKKKCLKSLLFYNWQKKVHRKSVKKGFEFTLMVLGESGLGKSTLINSLFLTDLYPGNAFQKYFKNWVWKLVYVSNL